MKIILIQDVDRIGRAGEVKDVANGYGRNYLLPKGLAELASADSLKRAGEYRKAEERRQQALNTEMEGLAGILDGLEVNIKAKAGDKGRLYGSVTSSDIAEEAQRLIGHEIDKRKIELHEPIHHLGEHEVTVKLSRDLAPTLKVMVTAEGMESGGEGEVEEAEVEAEKKKGRKKDTDIEPDAELAAGSDSAEASGEVPIAPADDSTEDTIAEASGAQTEEAAEDVFKEPSE
jgi:large subunit ribosomal protein L9